VDEVDEMMAYLIERNRMETEAIKQMSNKSQSGGMNRVSY
jgi:hypothetical protein